MKDDFFEKKLYDTLGQDIDIPNSFSNTISRFEYKNKRNIKTKLYTKIAMAFSVVMVSINLVTYGLIIGENFKAESSIGYVNNSLQQAVDNGYIQNVEMDYLYSNDVGAKVDYVVMSDYNLNILFNFDISNKNIRQNTQTDIEDLLIYDENGNIIYCYDYKTYKDFCKKKNIEYDEHEIQKYAKGFAIHQIELSSEIDKVLYTITTTKGFPKSRKLYIQFNTIYFDIERNEKTKGKWNLELNLQEQFYNREEIKYELETQNDDIELISANITDTMMKIIYKMKNIDISKSNNISIYVEDNFRNRYDMNKIQDSIVIYEDEISVTFSITNKYNLEYLVLYISIDKQEYTPIILRSKN